MGNVDLVMCRGCGNFEEVVEMDGDLVVRRGECQECGGTEFKDNDTGDVIRAE